MEFIQVDYAQLRTCLDIYTAVILFQKKDGTKRVLIGTRNKHTCESLLGTDMKSYLFGYDRKHTSSTGTVAVIDLAKADTRAIPVNRILGVQWCGILNSQNCDPAFAYYNSVEEQMRVEEEVRKRKDEEDLRAKLLSMTPEAIANLSAEERNELQQKVQQWSLS